MDELTPRVKTTITGEGTVVLHDTTRMGMHRLKVERMNDHPNFDLWRGMLPKEHRYIACWTEEQVTPVGYVGVLWIYYKIGSKEGSQ